MPGDSLTIGEMIAKEKTGDHRKGKGAKAEGRMEQWRGGEISKSAHWSGSQSHGSWMLAYQFVDADLFTIAKPIG